MITYRHVWTIWCAAVLVAVGAVVLLVVDEAQAAWRRVRGLPEIEERGQ